MNKLFDPRLPLSLYIHFPWCIKKCPYCDFNSHTLKGELPEDAYVQALLRNFSNMLPLSGDRPISSIFMGGGTPSLFSPTALKKLLDGIRAQSQLIPGVEITLEANPSTVESERFKHYYDLGINRLSLGIQSFNERHLRLLGRVHDGHTAHQAIKIAKQAGFSNLNLDLMFGLPQQSPTEGLVDLEQAIHYQPSHISWYELTIEPNTYFWHSPPRLPEEDVIATLQEEGQALLAAQGYQQYEVSAYTRNRPCQHNTNYWEFGDYLAIGAGSHAKITQPWNDTLLRLTHFPHPKQYLSSEHSFIQQQNIVGKAQRISEYFLNCLRLKAGVPISHFSQRTGLHLASVFAELTLAEKKGWLMPFKKRICPTPLGFRFLNNLIGLFLSDENSH